MNGEREIESDVTMSEKCAKRLDSLPTRYRGKKHNQRTADNTGLVSSPECTPASGLTRQCASAAWKPWEMM